MRKLAVWLASASALIVSAEANAAQYGAPESRTGAFVGARIQMSLGGQEVAKPRASLALAPTLSRTSRSGEIRTSIGEGAALSLRSRPSLTLMGVPAGQALTKDSSGETDSKRKLGLSDGGWVAVGVGAVALVGGIAFLYVREVAEDNSD